MKQAIELLKKRRSSLETEIAYLTDPVSIAIRKDIIRDINELLTFIENAKGAFKANQEWRDIFNEIYNVYDTGILPDGDHINIPTSLWLDKFIFKLKQLSRRSHQKNRSE